MEVHFEWVCLVLLNFEEERLVYSDNSSLQERIDDGLHIDFADNVNDVTLKQRPFRQNYVD